VADTFEAAADAVIEGRLAELQAPLRDQPSLATVRRDLQHQSPIDPNAREGATTARWESTRTRGRSQAPRGLISRQVA
jgi:hypothetical protein